MGSDPGFYLNPRGWIRMGSDPRFELKFNRMDQERLGS